MLHLPNRLLIVFTLVFLVFESTQNVPQECNNRYDTQNCAFKVPKNPIYEKVRVMYSGVSIEECMLRMEDLKWTVGLYCGESELCALGLDLETEYESKRQSDVTPVSEMCDVLVNRQKTNCDELIIQLYDKNILRGKLHSITLVT